MYAERAVAPSVDVWRSSGEVGERRILPDGCLDLLFDGEAVTVAGPDATARLHVSTGAGPVWAVRLHDGRGPALLGVPADELVDRLVPLEDVWGAARARSFTADVSADPVRALARRAVRADADPVGRRARQLLGAGVTVAQVADRLGWSARQLHRRTLPLFGYGPKHLSRVLRLARAVRAADGGHAWAEVAALAGYADQAHLARDVRALTGATPTRLRAERVRSVQDGA